MQLSIENDKWIGGGGKNKTGYYSFWLRVRDDKASLAISGWKFQPIGGRVGSPSQKKDKDAEGRAKFFDTTKFDRRTYEMIEDAARAYFGYVKGTENAT